MSEEKKDILTGGNADLLKEVEEAAKRGAKAGARGAGIWARIRMLLLGALIGVLCLTLFVANVHRRSFQETLKSLFTKETPVEDHDLTLENYGIFGYTVADFEEAVLGDATELKKLEVYSVEVSDLTTLTKSGLGKFKIFSKYQYVTYHGVAVYTVDLSQISKGSVTLDEENKVVTLTVPDVVLEPINIPSENIEFGDVEKGSFLAFGSMKFTPEEQAEVESNAKERMVEKLKNENAADQARTAAKHSIWEIFQPVITGVSPEYKLVVEFESETVPEEDAEVVIDGEETVADDPGEASAGEESGE
ncbi:MAG: DUF4230 domain-containing protein [Mogibacterium sp.]|nr:DUF4230 domain-containing protein [Mogibacterium sp.]